MNRIVVSVGLSISLLIAGAAESAMCGPQVMPGAQIDICLYRPSATGNSWDLTVYNNGSENLGAVNLLTSGNLVSMTLNPLNPGASVGYFTINPLSNGMNFAIISNNNAGETIAAAGAQDVLLATFWSTGGPRFSWSVPRSRPARTPSSTTT